MPVRSGPMKLLVTGGAGFIGSHYVRTVLGAAWGLDRPDRVTVLDKFTYAGNIDNLRLVEDDPRLDVVEGDILDRVLVRQLTAAADAIVHFAAESHVDRSIVGARDFVMTNVVGTQTLLHGASEQGIQKFVHISTDEVYGSIETGSWSEDAPVLPNSPYSASKAGADLVVRAYGHTYGVPVCITRGSNTYGPYQFPEKSVPLFVTNLLDGGRVPLYGDGRNVRDWLHVDDHCRAVHLVLLGGRPGESYNIGGGTELTNRDLTDRILSALGAGWGRVDLVPDRLGHDLRYALDCRKIENELGFRPLIAFPQGLAETVQWYRDRRDWWEPLRAGTSRSATATHREPE